MAAPIILAASLASCARSSGLPAVATMEMMLLWLSGFALGSHQDPGFVAIADFLDQHRRTPEFDVVGMRADRQDLHRIAIWRKIKLR